MNEISRRDYIRNRLTQVLHNEWKETGKTILHYKPFASTKIEIIFEVFANFGRNFFVKSSN